jgi:hypothetical protein
LTLRASIAQWVERYPNSKCHFPQLPHPFRTLVGDAILALSILARNAGFASQSAVDRIHVKIALSFIESAYFSGIRKAKAKAKAKKEGIAMLDSSLAWNMKHRPPPIFSMCPKKPRHRLVILNGSLISKWCQKNMGGII